MTVEHKLEYLKCPNCQRRFGLLAGVGMFTSEQLPDPFQAMCPHCEKKTTFAKASIQVIQS